MYYEMHNNHGLFLFLLMVFIYIFNILSETVRFIYRKGNICYCFLSQLYILQYTTSGRAQNTAKNNCWLHQINGQFLIVLQKETAIFIDDKHWHFTTKCDICLFNVFVFHSNLAFLTQTSICNKWAHFQSTKVN